MQDNKVRSGLVIKIPPGELPKRPFFFDIRCIGFRTIHELEALKSFQFGSTAEWNLFQSPGLLERVLDVQEQDDGTHLITFDSGKNVEVLLWIDTERGYSPVRYRQQQKRQANDVKVLHTCETEWTQVNDVWLPRKFRDIGRHENVAEMVFTWESVNVPLSDELFETDDFGISSNAVLVDSRLRPPLIEKVIEVDQLHATNPQTILKRHWLIIVNVIFVFSLIVLLLLLHRHKRFA